MAKIIPFRKREQPKRNRFTEEEIRKIIQSIQEQIPTHLQDLYIMITVYGWEE